MRAAHSLMSSMYLTIMKTCRLQSIDEAKGMALCAACSRDLLSFCIPLRRRRPTNAALTVGKYSCLS